MQYVQETDSKIIFNWLSDRVIPDKSNPVLETRASAPTRYFVSPGFHSGLISGAWEICSRTNFLEAGKQARTLLSLIQEMVSSFELSGFDVGSLPSIQAFETEDQSIFFEWIFEHSRVGFTFEPNPEESGWFLVSDRTLGNVSASGLLSGLGIEKAFLWLFNFVNPNI